MRKHDARKWLHAVLDLLPVILIPVFMIYSHRHQINDYQVQYAENKVVDFNQLVYDGNFTVVDDWYGVTSVSNNTAVIEYGGSNYGAQRIFDFTNYIGDIFLYKLDLFYTGSFDGYIRLRFPFQTTSFAVNNSKQTFTGTGTVVSSNSIYLQCLNNSGPDTVFYVSNFQLFDLTKMFGSGNEPTVEQFNSWYEESYYEYNLGYKDLLKGVSTVIYNDTEITSQLTYSLYNTVNNYFNFGNVFNLGGVYDWFTLNIFNGNAPLVVPIIWNIAVYEFIMDLIFLLYALFMFFIDFCTNLIDRFHTKCSGGK